MRWHGVGNTWQEVDDLERREGVSPDPDAAPFFGDSKTDWYEVEACYIYWSNFISCLPFDWADEFHEFRYHARYDSEHQY